MALLGWAAIFCVCAVGCASHRYGHLLAHDDKDLVGSDQAGAATWNPLVDESVAKLLGRCPPIGEHHAMVRGTTPELASTTIAQTVSHPIQGPAELPAPNTNGIESSPAALAVGPARVCFIGIENRSAEEMVDFKDQLYERIDSQINGAASFRSVSRRMIDAALIETRQRPDQLFLPQNRDLFAAVLGRHGTPIDYLLYATITSGTTDRNHSTQRDYVLTLEMVNVHTGDYLKESSKIRKGYHRTRAGKWWQFGMFDQADG
ncbi:MAG: penicillin-binding protein activator LpoB [Planctomycetota bacterium]